MDISVRDWMIIIGVLLIVAVLLDGYRRMRDPNRIRVSLTQVPESGDDDPGMSRELPNGGARIKPRGAAEAAGVADVESFSPVIDPDKDPAAEAAAEHSELAPNPRREEGVASNGEVGVAEPPLLTERPLAESAASSEAKPGELVHDEDANDPLFAQAPPMRAQRGENLDLLAGISAQDETAASAGQDAPQEVLMLHVVARSELGFPGDDILQVLLAYNLRFGDMDFFHRHDEAAGRGRVQFSVANMLQPGVFDIDRMGDFSTTGLIFFLSLPGPSDMMAAFELMLETARGVAEHLGGDVLDESRSVATRQTLDHMRQRIRELERKLLAQAGR